MLLQAIRSCLAQTVTDFEVLVADNCSQVAASEVLKELPDARVRVIRSAKRLNAVDNWNSCLAEARGEYISYLCDDDVYLPTYLEGLVGLLESDQTCQLATTPWQYTLPDLTIYNQPFSNAWRFYPRLEATQFVIDVLSMRRALSLDGSLCRTETLRGVGGFREVGFDGPWCADHFAWYRVALTGELVLTATEPLFLYRHHGSCISLNFDYMAHSERTAIYSLALESLRPQFPDPVAFDVARENYCDMFFRFGNDQVGAELATLIASSE